MPEFLLRYKLPPNLSTDRDLEMFLDQVTEMAEEVQRAAESVFHMSVVWEMREFGRSRGMPNFYVTGWVTDNEDFKAPTVIEAQEKILERMKELTPKDTKVGCWFQRVKGKWGEANGLL